MIIIYSLLVLVMLLALWVGGLYLWNKRTNPYYDSTKSHHRLKGFANLDANSMKPKSPEVRKAMFEAYDELKENFDWDMEAKKVPQMKTDAAWLHQPRDGIDFSWLGQSTVLWRLAGKNIITDPNFSTWLAIKWLGERRLTPVPLAIRDLPAIDIVLISHNHHDHLDSYSIKYIAKHNKAAVFYVPLGLKAWFRLRGVKNVIEMDWWQKQSLNNIDIYFVPAQHWSTRYILDRNRSLWGGFVVKWNGFSFYHAGDTGYNQDMFDMIGKQFAPIDWAMIPIGAYLPRDFMRPQHNNPAEALLIQKDIGAKRAFGVHWGTFVLSTEDTLQPMNDLTKAKKLQGVKNDKFITLKIGETKIVK
ncbi:MAG: MBL fold metallo-hydrolase [Alphaproteobacteria bacterium]